MLSIVTRGNGTAAQAYYEHLATGKDQQIEDYYARNEQGRWVGRGAEVLGLSGAVRKEEFQDLAFGFDPKTGKGLVRQAGEHHRSGWDLTFSAPKSVSVAWALGNDETQAKIAAAHDRAVEAALSYMERHAAFCRTGHGGKEELRADLACAVYRHYTSREQDPQIHSHAFVFNVGMGEDGKIRTLEGSHFFEWKMVGGAAYRVALAKELQEMEYTVLRDGKSFRLKEIDRGLERVFSTRRNQIEAALIERGASGAKASEVANLTTRKAKKEKDPLLLRKEWQDRAIGYERLLDREKREQSLAWDEIIRSIESSREYRNVLSGVSATRSEMLSEKETLVQEWARLNPPGQDRDSRLSDFKERRKILLDRWERVREAENPDPSSLISGLIEGNSTFTESRAHASILQEAQGRSGLPVAEQSVEQSLLDPEIVSLQKSPGRDRYTTLEMLRIEQEMVEIADRLSGSSDHGVGRDLLEAVLDRKSLSTEQKEIVRAITRRSDLALVQGWAGTGKSYALGSAREVWEAEGYRVRGAALSGKAALGLMEGSGIASTTLASLKREMGSDGKDPLTRRDILVIDEAGMVGSRQMREILLRVEDAGAKIVLVGDTKQLQAIEAGAAFRLLQERTGFVELSNIRRQSLSSDRQAIRDLALGRAEEALHDLSTRDRVHVYESGLGTKEGIGEAVSRDLLGGKSSVAIASTRAEAQDINEWARLHAKEKGLVENTGILVTTTQGEREFSGGDRVLFLRNDRNQDVLNGDFGTVQKIQNGKIEIRLDRGGMKEIDPQVYPHLEHGYAATCHKLQGATLDRCHVLAPDNGMAGREWAYVAGSRAREAFYVHANRMTLLELAPEWSKRRAKDTTLDYKGGQHERGMERDLCGARRNLGAAKDLVRRIDEALGSLGERHGLRGALSHRYLERTCRQNRSLEQSRATEELVIEIPPLERKSRKKERELTSPERGLGL